MKAKKFRVTLTVLSLAVCTILKYRNEVYCRWADGEFCSPEEGWGPCAPSQVPRAVSFLGSSSMAAFPGSAATPGEDAAGDRAVKSWSSSRTKEMLVTLKAHQQKGSSHLAGASSGAAASGSLPNTPCRSTGLSPGMLEFSLHLTCVCDPY